MRARSITRFAVLAAAFLLGSARAQSCVSDEDCQDGIWCNGIERCEGNYGRGMCMPAPRPMCPMKKVCDETTRKCFNPDVLDKTMCPEGENYSVADKKCVPTATPKP